MSQSQGIEVRPSRRTIAKGAAWAVPVIAIGAAAPAMAGSGNTCVPQFSLAPGSFKCCNTSVKNMKLVIKVTDVSGCLVDGVSSVCIDDIQLANRQSRGRLVFEGGNQCTTDGNTITAYLLGTHSCTVNLVVFYSIDGGTEQIAELQSENIPSGNTAGDCLPSVA